MTNERIAYYDQELTKFWNENEAAKDSLADDLRHCREVIKDLHRMFLFGLATGTIIVTNHDDREGGPQ